VTDVIVADATPAGLTAHTRDRYQYQHVIDTYYHGLENYTWTKFDGPDVLFGGGAEQFLPKGSYKGQDYYDLFSKNGYSLSWNNTALSQAPNDRRALGVFRTSNMDKWLDRHVYTDNIKGKTHPDGSDRTATDQPGLKEMTLKAIDILSTRTKKKKDGFFLMSEAAHVDKMMHVLDYDRALGELLEFDDTIKATIEKLKEMGELDDTLIVVTADHGHGFDVSHTSSYLINQPGLIFPQR
jgi:alkaline phosphatase